MNAMNEYRRWREMFAADPETSQELRAIENDPAEIEDRFYRELEFGTAGMRGVLGAGTNRMNVYTVRRATLALAQTILAIPGGAEKGVAIAFDSRIKSDVFARETALVLAGMGVKAMLFESLRPVPVLSFTVRHTGAIAGVVITASHNPSAYNGYKVYWTDGGQMPPDSVRAITDRLPAIGYGDARPMDEAEALAKGLLVMLGGEIDDDYIAAVKKLSIDPGLAREMGKQLKIVYTPLHGSGNIPVRRILREIGMENVYVVPEQELPDGNFPTVKVPNPEDPDAFALALKLQKQLGADLCVGTDPDCDRVGIACMREDGSVGLMNGNQIGCLLLHYILSARKRLGTLPANGAVVSSLVSTDMAKAICADFGVTHIDVLTGFKYIAEQIKLFEETGEHTFLFGFEESFGFLSGTDVRDKDGVNACLLIAEAACWYKQRGMTLLDGLEDLFRQYGFYGDKVVSVVMPGKDGLARMTEIMARLRADPPRDFAGVRVLAVNDYRTGVRTDCQGGRTKLTLPESNVLYYELEGGAWICVRPSGTEPKIKLYANAVSPSRDQTSAILSRIVDSAAGLLK